MIIQRMPEFDMFALSLIGTPVMHGKLSIQDQKTTALRPNKPQVIPQGAFGVLLAEQAAALEFWDY